MKKLLQIALVLSLSFSCFSCYYDELQERIIPELPSDPDDPNYVEIKFKADIQDAIFTVSCVDCHNASRNPDLRDGFSYNSLVPEYVTASNSDASLLYNKLASGHQNLGTEKIALIKAWIDQGAKNN